MQIYFLGGSPCSGKSTVAAMLAAQYGMLHYKLDDKLFDFMRMAAGAGSPRCCAYFSKSSDEIWLRSPHEQCDDEVEIYREMFPFMASDLRQLPASQPVIAEGAGFLPELMQQMRVDLHHYKCLVPTPAFQMEHYKQRAFVAEVLRDCSAPATAFANWMQRDILFADFAEQSAKALHYATMRTDGTLSPDAVATAVLSQFRLLSPM